MTTVAVISDAAEGAVVATSEVTAEGDIKIPQATIARDSFRNRARTVHSKLSRVKMDQTPRVTQLVQADQQVQSTCPLMPRLGPRR